MESGEHAAPTAEAVLTHPLDIGSPAAEPAMLDASQEPVLDVARALDEPVQGSLIESPEMAARAGALGTQEPDVAAETSHAQATETAPGQAEATEDEDNEDRSGFWLVPSASNLLPPCLQPGRPGHSRWHSCQRVSLQHDPELISARHAMADS